MVVLHSHSNILTFTGIEKGIVHCGWVHSIHVDGLCSGPISIDVQKKLLAPLTLFPSTFKVVVDPDVFTKLTVYLACPLFRYFCYLC